MIQEIIFIGIGFLLLVYGADLLVKGASNIAKKFDISEMLIGIIIVGIGTSLPEIIITIKSAIVGNSDIIMGNLLGSTICNLLLVLGIASLCRPLKIDERLMKVHLPIILIGTLLVGFVGNFGLNHSLLINRVDAIVLFIATYAYIMFTLEEGKRENPENEERIKHEIEEDMIHHKKVTVLGIIIYIVLGCIGLKFGADFVVDGAVEIAEMYNITQSIISMTIIAVGTALPEIITSIVATIKKDSDIAMGNVIGSNIYNLCLLPAIGGIINPIEFTMEYNGLLMFIASIVIYMFLINKVGKKNVIGRKKGAILIVVYLAYIARLFI